MELFVVQRNPSFDFCQQNCQVDCVKRAKVDELLLALDTSEKAGRKLNEHETINLVELMRGCKFARSFVELKMGQATASAPDV